MVEIVVVVESHADYTMLCALADRVFIEDGPKHHKQLEWIQLEDSEQVLPGLRKWSGIDPETPFTNWKHDIEAMSTKYPRLRVLPPKNRKPEPYYFAARKAIQLAALLRTNRTEPLPVAIILCPDIDNDEDRRKGMRQAAESVKEEMAVVFATPSREREAWILNAVVPENAAEEKMLANWKRKLKFHPCEEAERLRSPAKTSDANPNRDPKKVLTALTGGDRERELRGLKTAPLDLLEKRGKKTYLKDYLEQVRKTLLPLIAG